MGGDLGTGEPQVHDDAAVREPASRVLDFWFGMDPARHWQKDAALDAEIGERFGDLRRQVLATGAAGWRDHPDTMLAAVILLMPLMHAEDGPMQAKSVEEFERLGIGENAAFARDHRDVFERFGRFPGRNAALGRETTAEEQLWLDDNDGGW